MDKNKIISHFGLDFYTKIIADLNKYTELWGLSDIQQIDYYSVNCIFKCVSPKHGLCVLKIGNPSEEINTEYRLLKEYNGKRFCKVYEADTTNGVLLIERIVPGTQLRAEPNIDNRLDVFCNLWRKLHIKPTDNTVYPTYMEWVSEITEDMKEYKEYKKLYEKMQKAEQICRRIWEKYPDKMLLHGDLHHDNILLDNNRCYRIIDPKGVVGNIEFDIPRFILNEFDDVIDDKFHKKFVHITRTFAEKLNIPEYEIRCLTYIEICMSVCWCVNSGRKIDDFDGILFAEKLMDEY